jgi:hypothetical protein
MRHRAPEEQQHRAGSAKVGAENVANSKRLRKRMHEPSLALAELFFFYSASCEP